MKTANFNISTNSCSLPLFLPKHLLDQHRGVGEQLEETAFGVLLQGG